jgi:hypothetical protein
MPRAGSREKTQPVVILRVCEFFGVHSRYIHFQSARERR